MQIDLYIPLQSLIGSVAELINQGAFLYRRDHEPAPESNDFSWNPVMAEVAVEKVIRTDLCTLCERRLSYKPGQFITSDRPKLPYLVLVQNQFRRKSGSAFASADDNQVLDRIFRAEFGRPPEDFLIREALRCHFGSEEVTERRWFTNCATHLNRDIDQFSIRGVLVIGAAATIVEPDIGKVRALAGQVHERYGIPFVFCPGPQRLRHLEKSGAPAEEIIVEKRLIHTAMLAFRGIMSQAENPK